MIAAAQTGTFGSAPDWRNSNSHFSDSHYSDSLETNSIPPAFFSPEPPAGAGGGGSTRGIATAPAANGPAPFTRFAFGGDISTLGAGFVTASNITRHLNFRMNGSFLSYSISNLQTQGFNVGAKLDLASTRASVDYYPFHAGFRLSPGFMFYNQNHGTINLVADPGKSFSLGNYTYYSAPGSQAVTGQGAFGLGNGSHAFTLTTGWGNVFPRKGGHFSFPFELGVAFIKQPTLTFGLSGFVCDSNGNNCQNVATSPDVQANLAIQIQKYQNDLSNLKTYPIASFGMAYSFSLHRSPAY
jgi:hypothetical protein